MLNDHIPGGRRVRVAGTALVVLTALGLSACGKAAELGTERLIESQAGGDVDVDLRGDGGFSIDTEDGGMTIDENGNFVITGADGETVVGNADGDDGGFNVESDDGNFRMDSSGDIPPEWPDDVPEPARFAGATSSIQSNADELAIALSGTSDPDFIEEYGAALVSAGFERTSTFESAGNVMHIYENGEWIVSVNSFGEGADAQTSVSLVSNSSG